MAGPILRAGRCSCLADERTVLVAPQDDIQQAWLESVYLGARVAQAGDFDHRLSPEVQVGPARQIQQSEPGRGDVLAELPRPHFEALVLQLGEQFDVDEVDLAQVGLGWVGSRS